MVVTITIIWMGTIFCRISPARPIRARVTPFITGATTGLLTAMRVGDWKVVFAEQRAKEFDVWREQFDTLQDSQGIPSAPRPF